MGKDRARATRGGIVLPVLLFACVTVICAQQQVPTCPKAGCRQPIVSSWWRYCPSCGSPLPAFRLTGEPDGDERILGNVYVHARFGFAIEAPDESWQILKRRAAREMLPSAMVAMTGEPARNAVVIVRDLPGVTLAEFAAMTQPELQDSAVSGLEERTIEERPALVRTVRGRRQGVELVFRVLVTQNGTRRIQVAAWMERPQQAADEAVLDRIVDSFRFLPAPSGDGK